MYEILCIYVYIYVKCLHIKKYIDLLCAQMYKYTYVLLMVCVSKCLVLSLHVLYTGISF